MDPKAAVMNYQFGERAKSELIVLSQLSIALTGFSGDERTGARKMLLLMMDNVRTELAFAQKSTGSREFSWAINSLNEAISLLEGDQPDQAPQKIAQAITAVTTTAAEAWQVLSEHGLV